MTKATQTKTATQKRPTHRVVYRPKLKDGYGHGHQMGGAWQNSAGGISFPAFGGQITIWPVDQKEEGR